MTDAELWMKRCLALAQQAKERGEAAVGCVVVSDGRVVAEAAESVHADLDPTAHAEIQALRQASRTLGRLDLSGCELYTNVEPCLMCSHALRECGIAHVVVLEPYPELGGITSPYPILTADLPYPKPPPRLTWIPGRDLALPEE
jgi:tRNA(adenine34) deaminase